MTQDKARREVIPLFHASVTTYPRRIKQSKSSLYQGLATGANHVGSISDGKWQIVIIIIIIFFFFFFFFFLPCLWHMEGPCVNWSVELAINCHQPLRGFLFFYIMTFIFFHHSWFTVVCQLNHKPLQRQPAASPGWSSREETGSEALCALGRLEEQAFR